MNKKANVSVQHDVTGLKPVRALSRFSWKTALVIFWMAFSVALASWWIIFGLTLTSELSPEMSRQHIMLWSEGVTLVILLLLGGGALLYYNLTEVSRARRVREFFAAFTHDLKTSMASLRLQAESLEEDLKDVADAKLLRRLVKDTVRLELQLENSLLLASPEESSNLFLEDIDLSHLLNSVRHHWPDLKIDIEGGARVSADMRALESIFKNLLQNAVVHGKATRVAIQIRSEGSWVHVRVHDNGRGFGGDRDRLGQMFHRHSTTSGSGLGLFLVITMAQRLSGEARLCDVAEGFCVEILLPASRAKEST